MGWGRAPAVVLLVLGACSKPAPVVPTPPSPQPTMVLLESTGHDTPPRFGTELESSAPRLAASPSQPIASVARQRDGAGSEGDYEESTFVCGPIGSGEFVAPLPSPSLLTTVAGLELLDIDPEQPSYKPVLPKDVVGDRPASPTLRICVSEGGKVTSVKILKRSLPELDAQLPAVIGRWRFKPLRRDGAVQAFCFPMIYRVK